MINPAILEIFRAVAIGIAAAIAAVLIICPLAACMLSSRISQREERHRGQS